MREDNGHYLEGVIKMTNQEILKNLDDIEKLIIIHQEEMALLRLFQLKNALEEKEEEK